MDTLIRIAESGYVPDGVLRLGIRSLLRRRLRRQRRLPDAPSATPAPEPIASATERANEQHYELPPEFFRLLLGPRLKYSCCLWPASDTTLADAEEHMLALTTERAEIRDGMAVLDLGSGWGALGLWIAEHFPGCRITTVSNSATQQAFIRERARERGLSNVRTLRADINELRPDARYDRIVSVEMFEHVRNHAELLSRIASWLDGSGKLFVHLFCHRELSYRFEIDGDDDWMARHFFTGGMMPSLDMLDRLDDDLRVRRRWEVDGRQYEATLRAWLRRLDEHRQPALRVLERHYGADAGRWLVRWRMFLLASAELFGYREGREWLVGHYLLEPRSTPGRTAASRES